MAGKAIMCRTRSGTKRLNAGTYASSVMLLDCARLGHWQVEKQFEELFTFERDYRKWINLEYEPDGTIGAFEPEWNDFDRLSPATKMVHNTKRMTQPWKSGLPADFIPAETFPLFPPIGWLMRARRKLFGDYGLLPQLSQPPGRQAAEPVLRTPARVRGQGHRERGAAARGDAPQPRPPRRLRGDRAHPAARRLKAAQARFSSQRLLARPAGRRPSRPAASRSRRCVAT